MLGLSAHIVGVASQDTGGRGSDFDHGKAERVVDVRGLCGTTVVDLEPEGVQRQQGTCFCPILLQKSWHKYDKRL